jgi:hypothetical protein
MSEFVNAPQSFLFKKFNSDDRLTQRLHKSPQVKYLISYLSALGAETVLEEQSYFDRDYLAEFSAFYSTSSRGYVNTCRRLHFFSTNIDRTTLEQAAGEDQSAKIAMQDSYLGFSVIRPITNAPLGRTVLSWYPDPQKQNLPRVTNPSRQYIANIAGIPLTITGLAWQQQDSAVAACATIGLWSMLHSSAFDDHHAIPTTADITRHANSSTSLGNRVFPSRGLAVFQLAEAIKENNLSPILIEGTVSHTDFKFQCFTKEHFTSSCAAFIRSGYPVLIFGYQKKDGIVNQSIGHAICAVGFREADSSVFTSPDGITLSDSNIKYLYIHDDNIGPSVRFEVTEKIEKDYLDNDYTTLMLSPPQGEDSNPVVSDFIPSSIIVAVHNDLRISADDFHKKSLQIAKAIVIADKHLNPGNNIQLSIATRFVKLCDYLNMELERALNGSYQVLSKTRMSICENLSPMSLHIGLIRIALPDGTPLTDILCDTTDSDINLPVFGHIVFNKAISDNLNDLVESGILKPENLGPQVKAY